jgi:hypothetical protein
MTLGDTVIRGEPFKALAQNTFLYSEVVIRAEDHAKKGRGCRSKAFDEGGRALARVPFLISPPSIPVKDLLVATDLHNGRPLHNGDQAPPQSI